MKNAGMAVAKIISRSIKKQLIIVVCGPGNNAGDGFVLAEYLRKKGYQIEVFCMQKKYYQDDALKALNQLRIKTKNISDLKITKRSIIIDCLFGTGISRNISGVLRKLILKINKSKQKIISIDIPSGIHGDTGKIYGCAIKARETFALHAKKIGHTLNPGKIYSGKITIVDIGISKKFQSYI